MIAWLALLSSCLFIFMPKGPPQIHAPSCRAFGVHPPHLSLDAARPSMALAWKHVRRSPLVSHTWPSRDTLTTHPEEPHPRTRASGHPRNLSSQQEMLGRAQPPVREAQGRASKWRRRRRRPKRGDLELGAGSLRARLERLRPEPTPSSVGPGPRRQDGPQQKGTKQDRRAKGVVRSR